MFSASLPRIAHIAVASLLSLLLPALTSPAVIFASNTQTQVAAVTVSLPMRPGNAALTVDEFLLQTNAVRATNGLKALEVNTVLQQAAEQKIRDMEIRNYWEHFRPNDNKAPWDFMADAGYKYTVAGENLARGFRTAHGITEGWMESPAHRANLLSPLYTQVGFATGTGLDQNGQPTLITVQFLAAPAQ
jgi:uncharacterized protein YkwD